MLPIVEQSMIERVLGHLASHGIDDAVLSMGYRPDAFIESYPEGVIAGVRCTYAVEPSPLDTAGAIRFAATFGGIDDSFVVLNGDVLTDFDISGLVDFHRERGAEGTIGLTPVDDPSSFGVVPTEPDGKVIAFIEKPPRDEAPTNLINAGIYILEPSVLDRIAPDTRVSIERETFPAMVADGTLYAQGSDAYWLDTGTPDAYLRAHRDLLNGRRGSPPAPDAVVDPELGVGVWTIGEVDAVPGSTTRSLLGRGSSIGPNARVTDSVIGAGAIVEDGATVADSVLLAGARVAARATVDHSIIGPGAIIGQRCVVTGVSVVGAGAVIASGTTLDGGRYPTGS
jgi:mannose-1-phosphate guanylyltransferase